MANQLTDPTGHRFHLRAALADPRLDDVQDDGGGSNEAQDAALHLAIAIGYCRLCGVSGGEADSVLPPPLATAAVHGLSRWLTECAADVVGLRKKWEDLIPQDWRDDDGADALAKSWVKARMDAHAALIALQEAAKEQAVSGMATSSEALYKQIEDITCVQTPNGGHDGPLTKVDRALYELRDILESVVDTVRITNMRNMLTGEYKEFLPWWLDPEVLSQQGT